MVLQAGLAHPITATASLGLVIALVLTRGQYAGEPDPSTRRHVAVVGAALLGASLVIGWTAVTLLDHHLRTGLSAEARLAATGEGLFGIPTTVTSGDARAPDDVYYLLLALGVLTVAVTGYLTLRSASLTPRHSTEDAAKVRELLARHGGQDSLSCFSTRDDRSVAWSPNRSACVSFRVVSGAALASGDPVGSPAHWPEAISAFLEQARRHAWVPAVVAASLAGAKAWERHGGLTALELGDEAVLHRDTFTRQGRAMRNVRQAAGRASRAAYVVSIERLGELDPGRCQLLRACVWGNTLKALSRWSQSDSLYRFDVKFRPTWQPRYLVYANATGLPRIAVAYLDTESLVSLPGLGRRGPRTLVAEPVR